MSPNSKSRRSDAIIRPEVIWPTFGQATEQEALAGWWKDIKDREPAMAKAMMAWIDGATGSLARHLDGLTEAQLAGIVVELHAMATLTAHVVLQSCRQELLRDLPGASAA